MAVVTFALPEPDHSAMPYYGYDPGIADTASRVGVLRRSAWSVRVTGADTEGIGPASGLFPRRRR